jgi:hypothetical protein
VRECSSSPENFRATSFVDMKDSLIIDTIEVLRERVENAATTIRNKRNAGKVEESFRRRLHYCIDNNGGHFEHFL